MSGYRDPGRYSSYLRSRPVDLRRGGVNREEKVSCNRRGRNGLKTIDHVMIVQHGVDGLKAFRAFYMVGAHVMFEKSFIPYDAGPGHYFSLFR